MPHFILCNYNELNYITVDFLSIFIIGSDLREDTACLCSRGHFMDCTCDVLFVYMIFFHSFYKRDHSHKNYVLIILYAHHM